MQIHLDVSYFSLNSLLELSHKSPRIVEVTGCDWDTSFCGNLTVSGKWENIISASHQ